MNRIVHIYCPPEGNDYFVTADYKGNVSLWSFYKRQRIANFESKIDFGGKRLAVIPANQPIIVTGAYDIHGISAYNALTGELLWQRKDLKTVQNISYIPNEENKFLIGCGFAKKPFAILNALSGNTELSPRGVYKMFPSSHFPLALQVENNQVKLVRTSDWSALWKKPAQTFAVLDAGISNETVLISWAGGSLQCVDFYGNEIWEFSPPIGSHFLGITWNEALKLWFGIMWDFENNGEKILVSFNQYGNAVSKKKIGETEVFDFFGDGSHLVTDTGDIISLSSGEVTWKFDAVY